MADGEGGKEAFCLLLWRSTGGGITPSGKLVQEFDQAGEVEKFVRGYCTRPWDCFECPLLQEELAYHPEDAKRWICPSCLGPVMKTAKAQGNPLTLPGHFTEGQCQYEHCDRPARTEAGVDLPPRWSRFLQVVIGTINP